MGLHTNAGSDLTPEQRKQAEADAKNDGIIQDAIARADRDGSKPGVLTSDDQHYHATYDRLAEQAAFAAGDKHIKPLAVRIGPQYPTGLNWILSDAEKGKVDAGYACPRCLDDYPEVWAPACTTCLWPRELLNKIL